MAKNTAAMNSKTDAHPSANPPVFKREAGEAADPSEAIFFGCGYCSQVFHTKEQLETHIRLVHGGAPYLSTPAPLNPEQSELLHVPHTTLFTEGIPLSEVARHNVAEDCWIAVNGKVYDFTEFVDRHPGGRSLVLAWAGKDATKDFNKFHKDEWLKQWLRPDAYLGELGIKEDMMSACYWDQLRQVRVKELKEELHYFCDESGAAESAAPERAILGMQLSGDKVAARLKDLEAKKKAAAAAEDFMKAEEISKIMEKLKRQAAAPSGAAAGGIPMSEVARHNKVEDCWVALNGKVLDLTEFVAHNKDASFQILMVAGRDATEYFNKKEGKFPSEGWNKEHLRPEYVIGDAKEDPPLSAHEAKIRALKTELRHLEGPAVAAKPAEAAAEAAPAAKPAGPPPTEFQMYLRQRAVDAAVAFVGFALYRLARRVL